MPEFYLHFGECSRPFFCMCFQMRDIVKAVGNCSYNQLVEKIISCKQSDNSELAGEGERHTSVWIGLVFEFTSLH